MEYLKVLDEYLIGLKSRQKLAKLKVRNFK